MSKKLVMSWVSFAKTGEPGNREWRPVNGRDKAEYAVLDDGPVRMELPEAFSKRIGFLEEMSGLIQAYRTFDFGSHPAVEKMMKDKEKVREEEEQEEETRQKDLGDGDEQFDFTFDEIDDDKDFANDVEDEIENEHDEL